MIKIISDNGKTIEARSLDDLKDKVGEIFSMDKRDDVLLTYVVTTRPTSRRIAQ